jgi:hypothetical protein
VHKRAANDQTGLVRVVATRIEPDGTMLRRVVDTDRRSDGTEWEDLATRALIAAHRTGLFLAGPSTTSVSTIMCSW